MKHYVKHVALTLVSVSSLLSCSLSSSSTALTSDSEGGDTSSESNSESNSGSLSSSSNESSSTSSSVSYPKNNSKALLDYDTKKDELALDVYGYYPSNDESCTKLMAEAGVNGVIPTPQSCGYLSATDGQNYCNLVAKYGISDFPYVGSKDALKDDSLLNLSWLDTNKNVKGVYMYDEPFPSDIDLLASWASFFSKKYTDKQFMACVLDPDILAYPNVWNSDMTYLEYIDSYCSNVLDALGSLPKTLMGDTYPLEVIDGVQRIDKVHLAALSTLAEKGKRGGYKTNSCIMVSDCERWNEPTIDDLRFQTSALMCFGFSGYTLFTVDTPASGTQQFRKSMIKDGKETSIYPLVKQLNEENEAYDHVYLQFNWNGAFALSPSSPLSGYEDEAAAFKEMDDYNQPYSHISASDSEILNSASSDGYALVGSFADKAGNEAFGVMNYGNPTHDETHFTSLDFAKADYAKVYRNGKENDVALSGHRLSLSLKGGESAFIIPYFN